MRRISVISTLVVLAVLLTVAVWGCKNPDDGSKPVVPDPHGPGATGDPMDPGIPEPFAYEFGPVVDITIEGDGDIVLATEAGLELFTPYGVHKRMMSASYYQGLAMSNFGQVDTGRGIIGVVPENMCLPTPAFDDLYVSGGVPGVSFDPIWWGGEPDPYMPPGTCVNFASSSTFGSCDCTPHPIAYHPLNPPYLFQKVYTPNCIADSDCDWPFTNTIDVNDYAIVAYHPDAPWVPDYMYPIFEGGQDYLVYYDYPTYMGLQNAAAALGVVPACAINSNFIVWDLTSINYMSTRSGMTTSNICDFEFDNLHRLIWVMPNADSIAITEPVVFGAPIVVQKTIGGRQNGMGTLPGEFQGPRALAIDPRNQNIVVSDTGNKRVQIFDNDGNYIREFGAADPTFTPAAIRVDAFGAIYVSNINPNRAEGDNLRIYNEYGSPVIFGTIEGWVFDKDTNQPLDNARVMVQSTFNALSDITDENGYFEFPAVAQGTHNIVAEKYGFNSGQVNVTVNGGYKSKVDIYLKRVMTEPPGYGQVTGTVFSSLYNKPQPGLTAEIVGAGISNQTNGNGEFTLYNVPEGEHTFRLTGNGTIYYEKYIVVTKGGIVDLGVMYLPIP